MRNSRLSRLAATLGAIVCLAAVPGRAGHPVPFDVQLLTIDANEGIDVADFDNDGKLDVSAGRSWYRNGDWTPRPVRLIDDWNGYVESNGDFAYDVNGDGHTDIIAGSFRSTQVHWYENPGDVPLLQGYLWPKHLLVETTLGQNEASFLHDFDGDGTPEWVSNSWIKDNPLVIWRFSTTGEGEDAQPTLVKHVLGQHNGHGFGIGDLNNDGRDDIFVGTGWYEAPDGDLFENPWTFHGDWDSHASCPVLIRDLDNDGLNDVVVGAAHNYGLFLWHGRGTDSDGRLLFEEETLDDSFSQPHALAWADLDGDGRDELVTGKRVRAHNGRDPGGTEPPLVVYYTFDDQGRATRHLIDNGHVGIGLQIRPADIDADGDVDIAVAGKEGTEILWNRRNP